MLIDQQQSAGFFASCIAGVRDAVAYAISTFFFGLLYGAAAVATGLDPLVGMLSSALTFSASAQFAALEFWHDPLPVMTILLSVALVSGRNILLGLSMAGHLDRHSFATRCFCLTLLNDPAVFMILREPRKQDHLGYIFGYGVLLWTSWVSATAIGGVFSIELSRIDMSALSFVGPLVMTTMLMLFVSTSKRHLPAWAATGVTALVLALMGVATWLVFPVAVIAGVITTLLQHGKPKEGLK